MRQPVRQGMVMRYGGHAGLHRLYELLCKKSLHGGVHPSRRINTGEA